MKTASHFVVLLVALIAVTLLADGRGARSSRKKSSGTRANWVVRYANRNFQALAQGQKDALAQEKVVVFEWEDLKLEIKAS